MCEYTIIECGVCLKSFNDDPFIPLVPQELDHDCFQNFRERDSL